MSCPKDAAAVPTLKYRRGVDNVFYMPFLNSVIIEFSETFLPFLIGDKLRLPNYASCTVKCTL